MQTAFISHRACLKHDMGLHHPEAPARLQAIEGHLLASGLLPLLQQHEAPRASKAQLMRVHDADYVERIFSVAPQHGMIQLDPDTAMNPFTLEAALRAAGAAVLAVDLVMAGKIENAFCNVRPPGHHAEKRRAMGFCIFNNVAIGAAHAMVAHGMERVAIADFDVHHGNGTEDIFRKDARLLMVSIFQHPFYPYSGIEGRSEQMVNIPLAAHSDGAALRAAVHMHWLPALERFKPQLLMISAGFDAHRDDGMAMLRFTEDDYAWVTHALKAVAARHAQGRMVSVLEGGYELNSLARSVAAHVKALSDL